MARIELNYIDGLLFNKEEHRYFLNGRELSGITSVLTNQLFPMEYSGVPQKILDASKNYGTAVHKKLEKFDMEWTNDPQSVELQDYISICRENGLVHEASEYLVTNGDFASACDKVYRIDDTHISIGDIKTIYGDLTKKANKEKLERCRWQLSIYKYMAELINPQLTVKDIFVIHLRWKQKKNGDYDHTKQIIFLEPIEAATCKALLDAELRGEQFVLPVEQPQELKVDEGLIRQLLQTKADVEEKLSNIKAKLLSDMEALGETTYSTPTGLKIVRKLASVRKAFDMKTFTAMNPDFDLSPYMKESKVGGSLSIAV